MKQCLQQIGKRLVKWESSGGHRIDYFWLLPVPVIGWISTESLQGSLHFCCSFKESFFSSAILCSLDETKFFSSLEIGRQTQKMVFSCHQCVFVNKNCEYLCSLCRYSGCIMGDICSRIMFVYASVHSHTFMPLFLCFPGSLTLFSPLEN